MVMVRLKLNVQIKYSNSMFFKMRCRRVDQSASYPVRDLTYGDLVCRWIVRLPREAYESQPSAIFMGERRWQAAVISHLYSWERIQSVQLAENWWNAVVSLSARHQPSGSVLNRLHGNNASNYRWCHCTARCQSRVWTIAFVASSDVQRTTYRNCRMQTAFTWSHSD